MMEGKQIVVIFEDGTGSNKRTGLCTKIDDFFVVVDDKDYIPKNKIIRIEVLK